MSPISRAHSLSPPLARGRRAAPHCCRVFTLCKTALHKLEMDYIKTTEPRSFLILCIFRKLKKYPLRISVPLCLNNKSRCSSSYVTLL